MRGTLLTYLKAISFDVVWAKNAKVNVCSDRALVAFARHYHRILVCHDRHRDKRKDKETRVQISQEIYENGGQVIEVSGEPAQHELTSLGKILTHRKKWKEFFDNNDGIVIVYENRDMVTIPRAKLIRQIQGTLDHSTIPAIPLKSPRKATIKIRSPKPKKPDEKTFDDLMDFSNG
jgi:hypothetical protein